MAAARACLCRASFFMGLSSNLGALHRSCPHHAVPTCRGGPTVKLPVSSWDTDPPGRSWSHPTVCWAGVLGVLGAPQTLHSWSRGSPAQPPVSEGLGSAGLTLSTTLGTSGLEALWQLLCREVHNSPTFSFFFLFFLSSSFSPSVFSFSSSFSSSLSFSFSFSSVSLSSRPNPTAEHRGRFFAHMQHPAHANPAHPPGSHQTLTFQDCRHFTTAKGLWGTRLSNLQHRGDLKEQPEGGVR